MCSSVMQDWQEASEVSGDLMGLYNSTKNEVTPPRNSERFWGRSSRKAESLFSDNSIRRIPLDVAYLAIPPCNSESFWGRASPKAESLLSGDLICWIPLDASKITAALLNSKGFRDRASPKAESLFCRVWRWGRRRYFATIQRVQNKFPIWILTILEEKFKQVRDSQNPRTFYN